MKVKVVIQTFCFLSMMHSNKSVFKFFAAQALAILFAACGAVKPYVAKEQRNWQQIAAPPAEELLHSVYLIGDAGEPDITGTQEPALRLLEQQLRGQFYSEQDGGISQLPDSLKAVIFLGDNIYRDGLSLPDDPEREEEEQKIEEQMKIVLGWKKLKHAFIAVHHT